MSNFQAQISVLNPAEKADEQESLELAEWAKAYDPDGHKFFGDPPGQYRGGMVFYPEGVKMTATAIVFTNFGFAVAADGNQLRQHKRQRNATIQDGETDCAQKIFSVEKGSTVLAYILCGDVANRDRTFDVALELKHEVSVAVKRCHTKPETFVTAIGDALEQQIVRAIVDGRLESRLAPQIAFFGFVGEEPFYFRLNFWYTPLYTGLHHMVTKCDIESSERFHCCGSQEIEKMVRRWDVNIRQFIKKPLPAVRTLQDAIDITKGYIDACTPSLGPKLHPIIDDRQGLGGYLHLAIVVPRTRPSWFVRCFSSRQRVWSGGFQWKIRPKTPTCSLIVHTPLIAF